MPKGLDDKEDRRYVHSEESESKRGRSPRQAKRIPAAAVDKRRAKHSQAESGGARGRFGKRGASKMMSRTTP